MSVRNLFFFYVLGACLYAMRLRSLMLQELIRNERFLHDARRPSVMFSLGLLLLIWPYWIVDEIRVWMFEKE